ncbi:hypothetical protein ABTZ59_36390, partial [Streptomyces sp. NPDC094034]|uniref:hypothetical protein n=1 Tax=Streptomyces sp. NPDC094034 TaxID=3155309 RepID=UPI00332E787B
MTTTRTVAEKVRNLLDYLLNAEIAAYTNRVSENGTRVSWHATDPDIPFLASRGDPTQCQELRGFIVGVVPDRLAVGCSARRSEAPRL